MAERGWALGFSGRKGLGFEVSGQKGAGPQGFRAEFGWASGFIGRIGLGFKVLKQKDRGFRVCVQKGAGFDGLS